MKRLIKIKVKPNARESRIEEDADGSLSVRVRAAPVDGKANAELLKILAGHLKLSKSRLRIQSGIRGRTKLVVVEE